jgi:hypothetical protein
MTFCHYMLGHDAAGKRYTLLACAAMAGLDLDQAGAEQLSNTARVREYCAVYANELARQMACQESLRRAEYELSPMAVASELLYLLKFSKDDRARVAAGARLLDWFGPLDDRLKRASRDDLMYLAAHGRFPEERLQAPAPEVMPPAAASAPHGEILAPIGKEQPVEEEWAL